MDDLSERLSEILNDPESMEKVRLMAENLLGDDSAGENGAVTAAEESAAGLDGETLSKIMGIMSRLNSAKDDNRTALLLALKPHISEERRHKVDTAVKLLRLIELLPYLKDSGLLDF